MTDPITTPAQMREAAALLVENVIYRFHAGFYCHDTAAAIRALPVAAPEPQAPVTLTYTNWRGETSERTIIPQSIWFGSTEWHPEPQWLLRAWDCEKQAERDFALKDFGQKPEPQVRAEALEEAAQAVQIEIEAAKRFGAHHVPVLAAVRNAIRALIEKGTT